ncbi:MAG: hypothetical protein WC908_01965, partial [Candidatus Paceibacterota bacterium]
MELFKKVISLHQAAKISGYTQDHLGYLIRSGEMKGVKKGRNWFTTEYEIKSYLLKQKTIRAQSSNKGSVKKVISLHQAAKISGYTQDHLGYLIRSGEMKGVKKGRNWFTTEYEIKSYLLKQKTIRAQSSNKGSVKKVIQRKVANKKIPFLTSPRNFLLSSLIIIFIGLSSVSFYLFEKNNNNQIPSPTSQTLILSKQTPPVLPKGKVETQTLISPLPLGEGQGGGLTASVGNSLTSISDGLADGWVTFTEGILNNIKDSANGTKEFAISVWDGATFVGSGITNGISSQRMAISAWGRSIPSKIASNWNSFLTILSTPKPKTITVIPPSLTTTAL